MKLACVTTNIAADTAEFPGRSAQLVRSSTGFSNVVASAATNSGSTNVVASAATNSAAGSLKPAYTTNEVEMRMGMQMRREEGGPWQLAAAPSTSAGSSSFTPVLGSQTSGTNSAASTGGESDILKRMMQRREHE